MAGSFAGLLALVLVLAWLQIAAPSGLPGRAEPPAGGAADPALAETSPGPLLRGPTPALKRELQQRLLALRPPQAGAAEPPPPDPRPAFYRALAVDFAEAARAGAR